MTAAVGGALDDPRGVGDVVDLDVQEDVLRRAPPGGGVGVRRGRGTPDGLAGAVDPDVVGDPAAEGTESSAPVIQTRTGARRPTATTTVRAPASVMPASGESVDPTAITTARAASSTEPAHHR